MSTKDATLLKDGFTNDKGPGYTQDLNGAVNRPIGQTDFSVPFDTDAWDAEQKARAKMADTGYADDFRRRRYKPNMA